MRESDRGCVCAQKRGRDSGKCESACSLREPHFVALVVAAVTESYGQQTNVANLFQCYWMKKSPNK